MTADQLNAVLAAERALRAAESDLLGSDPDVVVTALVGAVEEAVSLDDRFEAAMRLERLADLCAQVVRPETLDAMFTILDDREPAVRVAAGEALLDVAYDYYAEVARAIDRALDDGGKVRALAELAFLIAEVGESSASKQLRRFLEHAEARHG